MEVVNPRHFLATLELYPVNIGRRVLETCGPTDKDAVQAVGSWAGVHGNGTLRAHVRISAVAAANAMWGF